MALRFRRTMKIAPGVRLNLGKKNVSVRVGPRGAGFTTGTAGKTVSAGLPGTGLHYSKKLPKGKRTVQPEVVALERPKMTLAGRVMFVIGLLLLAGVGVLMLIVATAPK